MTVLTEGTRVRVNSGEYAGNEGVILAVYTYSLANPDYDVLLDGHREPGIPDGSVFVEDFELEAI